MPTLAALASPAAGRGPAIGMFPTKVVGYGEQLLAIRKISKYCMNIQYSETPHATHRQTRYFGRRCKYDASCASSGAPKRNSRGGDGLGATNGMGICHSYTPDGRCVSLLKVLLTNFACTTASTVSTAAPATCLGHVSAGRGGAPDLISIGATASAACSSALASSVRRTTPWSS